MGVLPSVSDSNNSRQKVHLVHRLMHLLLKSSGCVGLCIALLPVG